jgi:predicted ArsR family transcriptional regulator
VKIQATDPGAPAGGTDRTRDAVARTILERGPQSAAALAKHLGLSAAAIRRHLDALVADGLLAERQARPSANRGRGRPAKVFVLTDSGRAAFPHAYDDLASTALRYLRSSGGDAAVTAFADSRADALVEVITAELDGTASLTTRAEALAESLSAHGYAATSSSAPAGVQICQHHCPVEHVAAEFPQLCEAETRAFERLLGTDVRRLATIAHGDGVCTTHVAVRTAPSASPDRSGRNQ